MLYHFSLWLNIKEFYTGLILVYTYTFKNRIIVSTLRGKMLCNTFNSSDFVELSVCRYTAHSSSALSQYLDKWQDHPLTFLCYKNQKSRTLEAAEKQKKPNSVISTHQGAITVTAISKYKLDPLTV